MPTRYRQPKTLAMAALAALFLGSAPLHAEDEARAPERVTFPSADGRTSLIGYLYKPSAMPSRRVPAVVMMHGRAGAYSACERRL